MGKWIRSFQEAAELLTLTREEISWFEQEHRSALSPPCRIPEYYSTLIDPDDPLDPIRRQCIPSSRELQVRSYELRDPLGESTFSPVSRIVHRYRDRALFLATDECLMYCRHCFRRRFTASGSMAASKSEIEEAAQYIKEHPEIRELLISGGDPLTIADTGLGDLLETFRKSRPGIVFRICTRVPVVYPGRITRRLISILKTFKPLYVVTQYNHPRECTVESMEKISRFTDQGITVVNQTVLLKGVNDSVSVLRELMTELVSHQIIPYYLFQGDLAEGTSHLRVPLKQSLQLAKSLKTQVSGLAMPKFAVDLPGGGGKIMLLEHRPIQKEPHRWGFQSGDTVYWYPLEG